MRCFYPQFKLTTLFRTRPELDWVAGVYERCFGQTLVGTFRGQLFVDALCQAKTAPTHVALVGPMQLDFGKDNARLCYGAEFKTVAQLLADVQQWLPAEAGDAVVVAPVVHLHVKAALPTAEGVPVWSVQRIDPTVAFVI